MVKLYAVFPISGSQTSGASNPATVGAWLAGIGSPFTWKESKASSSELSSALTSMWRSSRAPSGMLNVNGFFVPAKSSVSTAPSPLPSQSVSWARLFSDGGLTGAKHSPSCQAPPSMRYWTLIPSSGSANGKPGPSEFPLEANRPLKTSFVKPAMLIPVKSRVWIGLPLPPGPVASTSSAAQKYEPSGFVYGTSVSKSAIRPLSQ